MLRSVIHKFYLIGGLLVLSFLVGYAQLAFYLHHETQSATRGQKAVFLEREIRSLKENFLKCDFGRKALFSQEHPEADKKFGQLMELINKNLANLKAQPNRSGYTKRACQDIAIGHAIRKGIQPHNSA